MAGIDVERRAAHGETERHHLSDPHELRRVLAGWTSTWDWQDTIVDSDGYGDAALVAALPPEIDPAGGTAFDELYDELIDQLELPLDDDAELRASVVVNGRRWVLVEQTWHGSGWVPVNFWEYPLETVYQLVTFSEGGAERGVRVYRAGGVTVTLTVRGHFDARAGGEEVTEIEPEPIEIHSYDEIIADPDLPDDDPLRSIKLTTPALGPQQSEALARRLRVFYGPEAYIKVNDVSFRATPMIGDTQKTTPSSSAQTWQIAPPNIRSGATSVLQR